MTLNDLLLIAAAVAFVFQALEVVFGRFSVKWWALGVAFYLFAQVA